LKNPKKVKDANSPEDLPDQRILKVKDHWSHQDLKTLWIKADLEGRIEENKMARDMEDLIEERDLVVKCQETKEEGLLIKSPRDVLVVTNLKSRLILREFLVETK